MPEVRLIDANALLNDLKESAKAAREWREEAQDEEIKIRAEQAHGTFLECALRVKEAPTIEPEVRHGDWNTIYSFDGDVYCRCSNCEEEFVLDDGNPKSKGWKYCPSCGCKMDGGADNG